MRDWFRRIRNHLVDRLAALVWEGFCRLALFSDLTREMASIKADVDLLKKRLMGGAYLPAMIQLDVGKTEGTTSVLRHVEFQGQQLVQSQSSMGNLRIQESLYRTVVGELLVHVKSLEKSEGFPTTYSLFSVEEADLAAGGLYEELGKAWGTLSLAEALGENS